MRRSIKTFGLALMAACSLMALFAVAAQAEEALSNGGTAGTYTVLGLSSLVAGATLEGTGLAGILLIGSKNAYVSCTTGDVKGKGLAANEVLVEVTFLGCKAFTDTTKAELKACPVLGEPGKEEIKAIGIALPKLHGGELFVLFENEPGQLFAEIKFGPECGIGVKVKISGSVVALVDNGNSTIDHLLTFSEPIQKLFQVGAAGDHLLYGAAESYITGEAHVHLTGIHTGCTWAVL